MQTVMTIKNPQASADLSLNLTVTTNIPEEQILKNVLHNSNRIKKWIKLEEPHNKKLVICGSGASIANDIYEIRSLIDSSCDIWGLNNCANWLSNNGITADAQIIMDAQPKTINVIGPAKRHLFASQCDPSLFESVPDAELWQATYGEMLVDEQDGFPEHEDYCLIGASITVGNTAIVLAYAMGYRDIHIFGYDSSHTEDKSHVIYQSINDGDPLTYVYLNGKSYICSLTMKLQAENFIQRAKALTEEDCKITVHGKGYLPDLYQDSKREYSEQEKYQKMWSIPQYRDYSPGEQIVQTFLKIVEPNGLIIDYGCGTGRAGIELSKNGYDVLLLDFTENSRDKDARSLDFALCDLTRPIEHRSVFGFCTDVMEHIPTIDVEIVIENIMNSSDRVFFQISTVDDYFGALIGHPLHLTVQPHRWWIEKFKQYKIEWDECYPYESQFFITKE